jgi:GntR family transcriptional regulator
MTEPASSLLDVAQSGPLDATPQFAPLYRQIKILITQALQSGEWKPGELIPSESELAQRYRVSQGTVRKAIDALAAANIVVRRQGRGTFVASHLEVRTQFRFLRLRPDDPGLSSAATGEAAVRESGASSEHARSAAGQMLRSQVLDCRRTRAPAEIARSLQLKAGDPVVFIRRLLDLDGEPTVLDDLWLPGTRFRGLSAERLTNYGGPLYALFQEEFATRMIRAVERLKAVAASAEFARLLKIKTFDPLLLVDRLTYTYGDEPVEVRRGWCITDHHHYYNELA